MNCEQTGCAGQLSDGFCDRCGMARRTERARAVAIRSLPWSSAAAPGDRTPAPQADADDGLATAPAARLNVDTGPAADPETGDGAAGTVALSPRGTTTGSRTRLPSTPLGSARGSTQIVQPRRSGYPGAPQADPAPTVDPRTALLSEPVVPVRRRFCRSCGAAVGRGREGSTTATAGRTRGFCSACGQPFDFTPQLRPGDVVADQYVIEGCLAHGGMGWIYLARDGNVSDRWVVLKGLLNDADPDALAAAIAEQRYLAQVSHPKVVKIYNVVSHGAAGYIVMEFVTGTSLRGLLRPRVVDGRTVHTPMPVEQALGFIIEVLVALQYLHDLGLLYCDLKPDNILQVGSDVRLIDLGAVRRIGDDESAVFGTVGYQAPEVARSGPSVASDLYTVGRTLLVLTCDVEGFAGTYRQSLPAQHSHPALADNDSLYRLLDKACAPEPADRFRSADDLRLQAIGVRREVVAAARAGPIRAATSAAVSPVFRAPVLIGAQVGWRHLPQPRRDRTDPGAGFLQGIEAEPVGVQHLREEVARRTGHSYSVEVALALARAALVADEQDLAAHTIEEILARDPWEWRAVWLQGLGRLAADDPAAARDPFNAVYAELPGELAPKLALALACEGSGDHDVAAELYTTCLVTDAGYAPAGAFGLARLRAAAEDLDGAREVLEMVPLTSAAAGPARREIARLQVELARDLPDLARAHEVGGTAGFDATELATHRVRLFRRALLLVTDGQSGGADRDVGLAGLWRRQADLPDVGPTLGGYPATHRGIRLGLEAALHDLARLTPDRQVRRALIDEANAVRPWSRT